jgi:serine protease Do
MVNLPFVRSLSTRRLILLATAANLGVAAVVVGVPQSFVPAAATAYAAEGDTATRGWIGVQIQPITATIADGLGMKGSDGALVAEPQAGSPADKAGVMSGDVITAVNGTAVKDARDLAKTISAMAPGASAKLTIWRKGEEKSIAVTLGEFPKERDARANAPDSGAGAPKLGLTLAPAGEVAGSGSEGVVVIEIDPKGLASEHGVKTGDVILDVGGTKVGAPADVRNAIMDAHKNGKRTVLMRLKSDEVTKFVAIPIARA